MTARYHENALAVIERVKEKLEELKPSLPAGVEIVPVYDRSVLIHKSIETLTHELIKLAIAVALVCLIFLWHLPSALVILLTLPLAILMSFICMKYLGVSSNIMSLGGIAIAIGAMVDASIIMVENACKRLEEWEKKTQVQHKDARPVPIRNWYNQIAALSLWFRARRKTLRKALKKVKNQGTGQK